MNTEEYRHLARIEPQRKGRNKTTSAQRSALNTEAYRHKSTNKNNESLALLKKSPRGVQRGRGFAAPLRFSKFPNLNKPPRSSEISPAVKRNIPRGQAEYPPWLSGISPAVKRNNSPTAKWKTTPRGQARKEENMKQNGKLYLCATPIGNLEDITLRVLRTLREVDLIAAEDTRNSIKLLNHFDIKTPMTSYHEYNKIDKGHVLVEKLLAGTNIALITDAGTPGISDPGEELAAMCYEAGIEVTSLPGPAACITALTLSGLHTRRFAFEAFLPADKKERKTILEELSCETRTIILYEAPHRLVRTLGELREALGNRRMTLCRELTKKHETAFRTTIDDLMDFYKDEKPLGECVLVIEGRSRSEMEAEKRASWEEISIAEHVAMYEQQGNPRKDAMKLAAKDRGVSKRDIYKALLDGEGSAE